MNYTKSDATWITYIWKWYTMKRITEAELAKELREQYIKNPPEGMTSDEVRDMSDDDLLDMDYFLHEFDDLDDDDFGEEGFYIF